MNGIKFVKFFIAVLCFFVLSPDINGQLGKVNESDNESQLVIARINGPITFDGRSDEQAWKGIEPLTRNRTIMVKYSHMFNVR
ncbi:MAG: hypothetical protein JSV17_13210 [Candidatus Aminicenantes bacterium]|nr:MAG: hypothetical protein JSV17_13210 [Candidatus Aminicenantes bacterium]